MFPTDHPSPPRELVGCRSACRVAINVSDACRVATNVSAGLTLVVWSPGCSARRSCGTCTEQGDEVVTGLTDLDTAAILDGSPARQFFWHRHQGNYPGWLCTSTTDSLVGYESSLDRDQVLLADFDPLVTAILSQPFWLSGRDGDHVRWHAAGLPTDAQGRLRRDGGRQTGFSGEDQMVMSSLRFIAQGRRSMFLGADVIAAVHAAGRTGMVLGDTEASVTSCDPLDVRANVLALLWRQIGTPIYVDRYRGGL